MNEIERYNFWHCELDAFLIQHGKDVDGKIHKENNEIEVSHNDVLEDWDKKEGAI